MRAKSKADYLKKFEKRTIARAKLRLRKNAKMITKDESAVDSKTPKRPAPGAWMVRRSNG